MLLSFVLCTLLKMIFNSEKVRLELFEKPFFGKVYLDTEYRFPRKVLSRFFQSLVVDLRRNVSGKNTIAFLCIGNFHRPNRAKKQYLTVYVDVSDQFCPEGPFN